MATLPWWGRGLPTRDRELRVPIQALTAKPGAPPGTAPLPSHPNPEYRPIAGVLLQLLQDVLLTCFSSFSSRTCKCVKGFSTFHAHNALSLDHCLLTTLYQPHNVSHAHSSCGSDRMQKLRQ